MKYSQIVFGKSLTELTCTDIESFFSVEREETDQIEFKSYVALGSIDNKISGLVKSVAAFLNSDGGLLIWGAPLGEKQNRGDRKIVVFKGDLTNVPPDFLDKDWIINKVLTNIIPLPAGVRVQILRDSKHCVVVFEVDKSSYSPHQAEEKYYMRLDGQTRAAPHHYVEALFNKVSYAQLESYISPNYITPYNGRLGLGYSVDIKMFFANQSLFPNEEGFNYKIVLFGGVFSEGIDEFNHSQSGFIYHAEMVQREHRMYFLKHLLNDWNDIGRILVFFGGKTAPRKFCEYHVDFNKEIIDFKKVEEHFRIISENQLLSEFDMRSKENRDFRADYGMLRKV